VIGFDPLVLHIGPWAVRAFGLLALVGLGVAVGTMLRRARGSSIDREPIRRALVWAIPVGVLSARAVHVLGWWDYYLMHTADLDHLSPDGLALLGGLVGGGLAAWLALRRDPAQRRRIFDMAAPGVALGIALGRLGQFLDGYGQGVPSTLPWATQYASRLMATPDFGTPRHPVQVYDGLIAVGLLLILLRLPLAWRATTFLIVYASASLALAPLRLEPAFLFGLQLDQMLAGLVLVVGLLAALRIADVPRRIRSRMAWRSALHEADPVLET
jgi:phosphatidylglycerol---prolipoprotein diacylglyceryl transferase